MSVNGQTRAHHNHKPWFFYSKCYSSCSEYIGISYFPTDCCPPKDNPNKNTFSEWPRELSDTTRFYSTLWFAVLLGVSCGSRCSVCLRHMGLNSHSPTQCGNPQQSTASHTTPNSMDKNNRNVLLCNFMGTASSLDLGEVTRVYLQCSWWLWYSICFWSPLVSGAEFSFLVLLTLWLLFANRLLGSRPLSCSRKCFHFFGHGMSLPHTWVSCSFIVSLCGHLG